MVRPGRLAAVAAVATLLLANHALSAESLPQPESTSPSGSGPTWWRAEVTTLVDPADRLAAAIHLALGLSPTGRTQDGATGADALTATHAMAPATADDAATTLRATAARLLHATGMDGPGPRLRVEAALATLTSAESEALAPLLHGFLRLHDVATRVDLAAEAAQVGDLLAARDAFLLALADYAHAAPPPRGDGPVLHACPALALDLAGVDSTYEEDCAFVLDLGGNDRYRNNAGGTGNDATAIRVLPPALHISLNGFPAAALIDLGGDDTYGHPEVARSGSMGGGSIGVGILVDQGGDDTYGVMEMVEVAMGAGAACARSMHGNVFCHAGSPLASAEELAPYLGGDAVGIAAGWRVTCILTAGGDVDCRAADDRATSLDDHGGDAVQVRVGHQQMCLLTQGGDVRCRGDPEPPEGEPWDYHGGDAVGLDLSDDHLCILLTRGDLVCRGANDFGESEPYTGGDAVQVAVANRVTCIRTVDANARCWGRDPLEDRGGDVVHVATPGSGKMCVLTTAGDVRCSDGPVYPWPDATALDMGFFLGSPCVITGYGIMDCFGHHHRRVDHAQRFGAAGGAHWGLGFLLDDGGDDTYVTGPGGANGGSNGEAMGLLLDTGGDDIYRSDSLGSNGGASDELFGGLTIPVYTTPIFVGWNAGHRLAGLVDLDGADRYEDQHVTCDDCSMVPKGTLGMQLDLPSLRPR